MRYLRALRSAHGEFILVHEAGQFLVLWPVLAELEDEGGPG